jgi:hypothetical protein
VAKDDKKSKDRKRAAVADTAPGFSLN